MVTHGHSREQEALERELELQELEGWENEALRRPGWVQAAGACLAGLALGLGVLALGALAALGAALLQ